MTLQDIGSIGEVIGAFGNVPADVVESWIAYFLSVVRTPGGAVWWNLNKALFTPSLVADIDRRIATSGNAPHMLDIIPLFAVRDAGGRPASASVGAR